MKKPLLGDGCLVLTVSAVVIFFFLSSCEIYQPRHLPDGLDLAPNIEQLTTATSAPGVNPTDGLDLTEVAILAVRGNPELKAQRKKLGVARAQVFSAGLLPDPQMSANIDFPTGNVPGTVNAFGLGLGYDIVSLIKRGAQMASAQQAKQQINLELMWQEWQVSQQARSLAVRLVSQRHRISMLHKMRNSYRQRYHQSRDAMARGDLTMDVAGTDLTALLDMLSQINQQEQAANDTSHELHLLLGLSSDAPLVVHLPSLPPLPMTPVPSRQLATLAQRRPDLLALQAGYRSQEAKVRTAILSQFPAFSIGITRARDTGSLYTTGINIGLNLPLFSGNRGGIAIERATREQLAQEYQLRLDQTAVDVDKLVRLQGIIASQQQYLKDYLPNLNKLVARGREAYLRGDIDALTFLNMESTWINKRLEQSNLNQTQWENLIALQTLLAIAGDGALQAPDVTAGGKK